MPLFGKTPSDTTSSWEPAGGRRAPRPHGRRGPERRVHLRPLGLGVRPAGRGGLRAARLRRRLVDLPHRHPGRSLGSEPGAAGPDPGDVQRPGARHVADGAEAEHLGADGIVGVHPAHAGLRVGPGRPRVPRHGHGGARLPAARRGPPGPRRPAPSPPTCRPRTSSGCWRPARSRSPSCSAPASTTSPTSRRCRRCARRARTRRWCSSPRGSTRRASSPSRACRPRPPRPARAGIVGVSVGVSNHVWGEHATEFLATGTAVRRLADEHRLPDTSPKPTFTLGLDA